MNPLIIIGTERRGTNFLRGSINDHPDIKCVSALLAGREEIRKINHQNYFEDDGWLKNLTHEESIKYMEERVWDQDERFGFKILFWQMDECKIWDYLSKKDFYCILALRNPIATYISFLQASIIDSWSLSDGQEQTKTPKVEIDVESFYLYLNRIVAWESRAINTFKNIHMVHYKDMVMDYNNTMDGVFEYLGISQHNPTQHLKKQNSWDFKERVFKFDEFSRELKKQYRYMLNDLV
jgi:hypothetical protein